MFTRLFAKCVEDGTIEFKAIQHPTKERSYAVLAIYPTCMEVIGSNDFYNTCNSLKSFTSIDHSAVASAMEKFRIASANPQKLK